MAWGDSGDERLDALPTHEDDQARGTADEVGGGVMSQGGTAEVRGDPSGQPVPEEDGGDDQTGMAGVPPGGPISRV
jgi:hypothetical protein